MRDAASPEHLSDITFLSVNQDKTCLAVGTGRGFMIFSTETCALLHNEECGAVSIVEMLFRTSLVAFVGHSARRGVGSPQLSPGLSPGRQLTMWNTKERSEICHLVFEKLIYGVRMSHRRIVVLLREEVHILDLTTMKRLHVISRAPSPYIDPEVASLCCDPDRGYLALPMGLATGQHTASFRLESGLEQASAAGTRGEEEKIGLVSLIDTHTLQPVGVLLAHQSPVQALALNLTGHILATASKTASVIRVFAVPSLEMLCVFRRGASHCRIFELSFSLDSRFLCATASSGTVHIFKHSEEMLTTVPSSPLLKASPALSLASTGVGSTLDAGVTSSPSSLRPAVNLGPDNSWDDFMLPEAAIDNMDEAQFDDDDDMSEWDLVVDVRGPERALESLEFLHADSPSPNSGMDAFQVLAKSMEAAVGNVVKHARSSLQLLPQSCREMVDAERAFAFVRVRGEEAPQTSQCPSPHPPSSPTLSSVLNSIGGSGSLGMACSYVACVNPKAGVGGGRLEVLVATRRGCAHVYECDSRLGGDGHLHAEHSIAPQSFDEVQKTPRNHGRGTPPAPITLANKSVEGGATQSLEASNLRRAQLGA